MKIMNKKQLFALAPCFIAALNCADVYADICPSDFYVGLDVLKTNYSTKEGYGRNVFAKNPTAFNAFVGYKLPNNFFVEAGYEWAGNKSRTAKITNQDTFLGVQDAFSEDWAIIQSKIKKQLPYVSVGIKYEIPQFTDTSVFALAGISALKVKAVYADVSDAGNETPAQDTIDASRRTFKKNKMIPLLKVGVSHNFSKNLGLRFTGSWYNLSNVKLDRPIERPSSSAVIRLKDNYSFGLGLTYSF